MNSYSQFEVGDVLIVTSHPDNLFLGDLMRVSATEKAGFLGLKGVWLTGKETGQEAGGFSLTTFRKATKLDKVMK